MAQAWLIYGEDADSNVDKRFKAERQDDGTWNLRLPDPWIKDKTLTATRPTGTTQEQVAQVLDGALAKNKSVIANEATGRKEYRDLAASYGFS